MSSGIVNKQIASTTFVKIPLIPLPTIKIPRYLGGKIPPIPKTVD